MFVITVNLAKETVNSCMIYADAKVPSLTI